MRRLGGDAEFGEAARGDVTEPQRRGSFFQGDLAQTGVAGHGRLLERGQAERVLRGGRRGQQDEPQNDRSTA